VNFMMFAGRRLCARELLRLLEGGRQIRSVPSRVMILMDSAACQTDARDGVKVLRVLAEDNEINVLGLPRIQAPAGSGSA